MSARALMNARMLNGAVDNDVEKLIGIFLGFFLGPVASLGAGFRCVRQSNIPPPLSWLWRRSSSREY
jgi:hypothetical protein